MRRARVLVQGIFAGILEEHSQQHYSFTYSETYQGPPVSLTLPTALRSYSFTKFPAFFEGLLPEGPQLESLLRREKIDRKDNFSQLLVVGQDLVGDVTVEPSSESDS